MRASRWARSAVLTGISLLALGTPLMVGVSAASGPTNPPWEPDANAAAPYGNVVFYDANGNQVTSGTNLSNPFAYVVAVTPADAERERKRLSTSTTHSTASRSPGNWTGTSEAGPTTFNPASSLPAGTPADIAAFAPTYPVVGHLDGRHQHLAGVQRPQHARAGYANTIQVRLTDSGPRGARQRGRHVLGIRHRLQHDIVADHRRRHDGPGQTAGLSCTRYSVLPAPPWRHRPPLLTVSGTQVTLTATVTPSSCRGRGPVLRRHDRLGSPVTVTSGTASMFITVPPLVTTATRAEFVTRNAATATIIGGSTSNAVPYTITSSPPTVTVTRFSPTRLGQGASNIGVTITGTGFVAGATVSVAGISFSSVSVVNSTTITAKAKVASSAKVGAANVTVTDSVGSGSCTTCLTIVAAPTVKSITPPSVTGASKSVTITGTGFASGATVTGPTRVTFSKVKVVSSTKITATVKVASSAKAGKHLAVTVVNGAAGGEGLGTGKVLTIFAAPTVKSIKPSSLNPGASTSVTITGTGFVSGATVTGPTRVKFSKVKVVSSTKITATVKVASSAKAGKHLSVTVVNGVAGGGGRGTGMVLTIT